MKKLSKKQRERDVKISLLHRQGRQLVTNYKSNGLSSFSGADTNNWIDRYKDKGNRSDP